MSPDDELVEVMSDLGVVGFNPYCDAVRQNMSGGPRIWYYRDGAIKWVEKERRPQRRWSSPFEVDAAQVERTLGVADDWDIIDKRLHNALVSGPLSRATNAHEGIAWGVVLLFGNEIRNGNRPLQRTLKAIPGVGDATAAEIRRGLYEYKEAPAFGGEFLEDADRRNAGGRRE